MMARVSPDICDAEYRGARAPQQERLQIVGLGPFAAIKSAAKNRNGIARTSIAGILLRGMGLVFICFSVEVENPGTESTRHNAGLPDFYTGLSKQIIGKCPDAGNSFFPVFSVVSIITHVHIPGHFQPVSGQVWIRAFSEPHFAGSPRKTLLPGWMYRFPGWERRGFHRLLPLTAI